MKQSLLEGSGDTHVREVVGQGFSQTEISHKADSPDPRVGGTKIIFDTRLADITKRSETGQLDAFMKAKAEDKQKKDRARDLERQRQMLQQMIEEEEKERRMLLKNTAPKDVLTVNEKNQSGGFERSSRKESLRGVTPGGPPAEAADHDLYGVDSINDVSPELLTTIERFNMVMGFLAKHCHTNEDREYVSALIVRMLPQLETLDLDKIGQMLDYFDEALQHYNSLPTSNLVCLKDFKRVTSEYVELRLRKANVEKMLQENQEIAAPTDVDTSSIINTVESIAQLKQSLSEQKDKLAVFNSYKQQLKKLQATDSELLQ